LKNKTKPLYLEKINWIDQYLIKNFLKVIKKLSNRIEKGKERKREIGTSLFILRNLHFVIPPDSYRDAQLENRRFYSYYVIPIT